MCPRRTSFLFFLNLGFSFRGLRVFGGEFLRSRLELGATVPLRSAAELYWSQLDPVSPKAEDLDCHQPAMLPNCCKCLRHGVINTRDVAASIRILGIRLSKYWRFQRAEIIRWIKPLALVPSCERQVKWASLGSPSKRPKRFSATPTSKPL